MNQTYIRDVSKHVGEEITLKGWLYNMRSSGKLMFPQIRDGSGVGVGAPQFGPRRGVFVGVTKAF